MGDEKDVHEHIDRLNQELDRLDVSNDEERQVVERLRGDIDELVEVSKQDAETRDESVFERLDEAIEEFQVKYPDLTVALKKVLDVLSASGI